MFNDDILSIMISFLDQRSLFSFIVISKKEYDRCRKDRFWKMLGNIHHPYLNIRTFIQYKEKNPFFLYPHQVHIAIWENDWGKSLWNTSDMVNNYLRSIFRDMLIVQKLRDLYSHNKDLSNDWKICLNKTIDLYLTRSEGNRKDMKEYMSIN